MNVKELSKEQLLELKQNHLSSKNENLSYGELADADNIISDEEVFEAYGDVNFTNDDFFCTANH